jgi:hypothetical protein
VYLKIFEAKRNATYVAKRERAFAFVLSFSIQNSVDKKLGFRRGEARTFYIHIKPEYTHEYNRPLSKILNGNHISNYFSSTRYLRHYSVSIHTCKAREEAVRVATAVEASEAQSEGTWEMIWCLLRHRQHAI